MDTEHPQKTMTTHNSADSQHPRQHAPVWPPPPTSDAAPEPYPQMTALTEFRDNRGLTTATAIVLGLNAFATALATIVASSVALTPDAVTFGHNIAMVALMLMVATPVIFLFWTYNAYANVGVLARTPSRTSPVWAVVYFFVPGLNLFRPCMVFVEMWNRSGPDPAVEEEAAQPTLVLAWWLIFLIHSFIPVIARFYLGVSVPFVALTSCASTLIATLLAVRVVSGITQRQIVRYKAIMKAYGYTV